MKTTYLFILILQMNQYDFYHDHAHTTGYVDEDLDWENGDPMSAMHFKKKRSGPMAILGGFLAVGLLLFYPTMGLKMPQRDNPFYYRRKFATATTIQQFQTVSLMDYGGNPEKGLDTNVILGPTGFKMVGNGLRYDLDNYNDLIC